MGLFHFTGTLPCYIHLVYIYIKVHSVRKLLFHRISFDFLGKFRLSCPFYLRVELLHQRVCII